MEKMRRFYSTFFLGLNALSLLGSLVLNCVFSQDPPFGKGKLFKGGKRHNNKSLFEKWRPTQILVKESKTCQNIFSIEVSMQKHPDLASCIWDGLKNDSGSEVLKPLTKEEKKQYYLDFGINKKDAALKKILKKRLI